MGMGTPAVAPVFHWTPTPIYAVADKAGRPYSFDSPAVTTIGATPAPTVPDDVVVDCVIVPVTVTPEGSPMGEFEMTRIVITMLDVDFAKIVGPPIADTIIVNGTTEYTLDYVAPAIGLFDVTVYTLYATARDQS